MALSSTSEAGQGVAPCDEDIIPILPMRYQLSGDAIKGMVGSGAATAPAPSITSHPNHDLNRIRQGFVFIYAEDHVDEVTDPEGKWQVFRYMTTGEDENSQVARADTETSTHGSEYTFKKYHWTDGHAGGGWELKPEERSYPYAFVSNQVSTVWVAYSEFRWPAWFFTKATSDTAFRNKLMTQGDVIARSGTHVAPLSDLADLSPAFYADGPTDDDANNLGNALRQASVRQAPMSSVARCLNSQTHGVVVGLHDPIGEHLDLGAAAAHMAEAKRNFLAEHQYPMTIGKHVEQIRQMEQDNRYGITRLINRNLSPDFGGFDEGVLWEHFDRDLSRMESTVRQIEEEEGTFHRAIRQMEARTAPGTVMDLLQVTRIEAEAKSGTDQEEICAFAMHIFARTQHFLGATDPGSQHLYRVINGTGSGLTIEVDKVLAITTQLVTASTKLHESFVPAFNAVLTAYGKEWALVVAAGGPQGIHIQTMTRTMFRQTQVTFNATSDLSTHFQRILQQSWGGVAPPGASAIGIDLFGSQTTRAIQPGARGMQVQSFYANTSVMADASTVQALDRLRGSQLAGHGLGMVAGFLSLFTTVKNYGKIVENETSFGAAAQNPIVQIIAAYGDAYASVMGLRQFAAMRNVTSSQIALRALFSGVPNLGQAMRVQPAVGNYALRSFRFLSRAAGAIGIAIAGFMSVEGFARGDFAMGIGNLMIMVGSIALLFATGIGAALAVVIVIVGIIVTLFANSEAERWVELSFWGTSGEYWNEQRRPMANRMERAKVLAYPGTSDYNFIRAEFDEELERLFNMFATLELRNPVTGDNQVEIHCSLIQGPEDISRITARSMYSSGFRHRDGVTGVPFFVRPGVARMSYGAPANDDTEWNDATLIVDVSQRPEGNLRDTLMLTGADL